MTKPTPPNGLLIVAAVVILVGCGTQHPRSSDVSENPSKPIEDVLAAHSDSLMALPGVVGTAVGLCDGVPCIRVLLADSSSEARERVPDSLGGYRVETMVTGPFRMRGGS